MISLRRILVVLSFIACLGGSFSVLSAESLEVGQPFPAFEGMQDQHELDYPMPEKTRYVVVSYTMSVGKAANGYFSAQPKDYLQANHAVYVANIYGMPAVGRFFAMPKMRKYHHRIMLADAEGLLDDFPQEEDRLTVFELGASGRIEAIRYWDPKSGQAPF
ncbi:hypothetical protein [Coraliomargarita parva]|uniref:hypothetical protein n=1 Tax=Coraliomargarita parva TaxID=3014050 RepID=UPI0022B4E727|nr:hypothetical protein [Coraliomargarita parva]